METKEKRREQPRQQQNQQERPRRPRGEGEAPAARRPERRAGEETRREKPRPEGKPAQRKTADSRQGRPAPRPAAEESRKQRTAPEEQRKRRRPEGEQPRKERPAADADRPRRQRPVQEEQPRQRSAREEERGQRPRKEGAKPRPAPQEAPRQHRRKIQDDGIPYSAPKGTGPRKSAPKMTMEEAQALRARQLAQDTPQEQAEKKGALQGFISGIRGKGEGGQDAAAKAAQRRKARAAEAEKKKQKALRHDTPAIIYTQPRVFSRDRLLLQLLTVTAVVAAVIIGMSVFFKVETITVAGADTYSIDAIKEASGIREGDNLLTFSKARASAQIQAKIAYVDNIRIGIKLPDTVIIYVEELDVAYAIESDQGDLWLINSEGRVVQQITKDQVDKYTRVLGVVLSKPQVGSNAVAADEIPEETLESGEPVPITVTGAQRLSSVLQILKALEANDIVGEAASVDVSELEDVRLWYGNQYEVLLGDTTRMEYKIACMNDAILQMSDYQSGILDVSFRTWEDMVGYTPFG